jgi:hypothetical protein
MWSVCLSLPVIGAAGAASERGVDLTVPEHPVAARLIAARQLIEARLDVRHVRLGHAFALIDVDIVERVVGVLVRASEPAELVVFGDPQAGALQFPAGNADCLLARAESLDAVVHGLLGLFGVLDRLALFLVLNREPAGQVELLCPVGRQVLVGVRRGLNVGDDAVRALVLLLDLLDWVGNPLRLLSCQFDEAAVAQFVGVLNRLVVRGEQVLQFVHAAGALAGGDSLDALLLRSASGRRGDPLGLFGGDCPLNERLGVLAGLERRLLGLLSENVVLLALRARLLDRLVHRGEPVADRRGEPLLAVPEQLLGLAVDLSLFGVLLQLCDGLAERVVALEQLADERAQHDRGGGEHDPPRAAEERIKALPSPPMIAAPE